MNIFKKIGFITLTIGALSSAFSTYAQDGSYLTVAPARLKSDYKVSEKIDRQVRSKIERGVAKYGISAVPGMSRFALVPEIVIINEQTRSTIPATAEIEFDLVLSLLDLDDGRVFANYSYTTTSSGTNKGNAISKGVSSIRFERDPNFSAFCAQATNKVLGYYEAQIPAIIAKAKSAAGSRDYQYAIYLLTQIPSECPSYTRKVAPLICDYYVQEVEDFGAQVLAEAEAAWAASPNAEGAARVAEILAAMPPNCGSSAGARALVNKIGNKFEMIEQWERDYMVREQRYANNQEMARIEAARAIGVAYAKNQPDVIYHYNEVILW